MNKGGFRVKSITTGQLIVALRSIDCFQFEKFIAELLEQTYNMETQTTRGSADGGVDVIVQSDTYPDDWGVTGEKYVEFIQVKQKTTGGISEGLKNCNELPGSIHPAYSDLGVVDRASVFTTLDVDEELIKTPIHDKVSIHSLSWIVDHIRRHNKEDLVEQYSRKPFSEIDGDDLTEYKRVQLTVPKDIRDEFNNIGYARLKLALRDGEEDISWDSQKVLQTAAIQVLLKNTDLWVEEVKELTQ